VSGTVQRLRFFVSDAWDEWRHSPGVNLLALGTLAAALFLAGLASLVLSNVGRGVEALQGDVRVEIYLRDDLAPEAREALRGEIEAFPGVRRLDYVDKEQALARYRLWAGDAAPLLGELESNPLPASFEASLQPGGQGEAAGERLVRELSQREGVEDVRFDRAWLGRLEAMLGLARVGGSAVALVVFGAVIFVMASVLRLAVYARRDEIDIMLLVGATPAFVRGPFLVAGLAQGLASSLLALLLVEATRRAVLYYAGAGSIALLDLVAGRPLPVGASALIGLVGLCVSAVGSYFAVRRSL